jgi:hypothetical protein
MMSATVVADILPAVLEIHTLSGGVAELWPEYLAPDPPRGRVLDEESQVLLRFGLAAPFVHERVGRFSHACWRFSACLNPMTRLLSN